MKNNKIKAIFFDLFFTLIVPVYSRGRNEYDVLDISVKEWEKYAEDNILYRKRALGKITDEKEIIEEIIKSLPYDVNQEQKDEILYLRQKRMRQALQMVDSSIIRTITELHNQGIKIGLISNADRIDRRSWEDSPLYKIFDDAVFSCDVGYLKPDAEIYKLAMTRLNIKAEQAVFVGDGGSNELTGAKNAGMLPIFTEYLEKKEESIKNKLMKEAIYHIEDFGELLTIVKQNMEKKDDVDKTKQNI